MIPTASGGEEADEENDTHILKEKERRTVKTNEFV